MGGHAFSNPRYSAMRFPRLRPSQYAAIKSHFSTRLLDIFHHVGVGIEAPEKNDYGDVDIVVCRPRAAPLIGASLKDLKPHIEKHLGATLGRFGQQGVLFLAVRIPEFARATSEGAGGEEGGDGAVDNNHGEGEVKQQHDIVQIDISICPTPSLFAYTLFTASHGDLYGFLKTGLRPFGLSLRPSGLWMRVAEVEETEFGDVDSDSGSGKESVQSGDDDSLVFLSNDVDAILSFLGLHADKWKTGFKSSEDMFEFAVSAKWFSRCDFCPEKKGEQGDGGKLDEEALGKLSRPASPTYSVQSDTMTMSSAATSTTGSTATLITNASSKANNTTAQKCRCYRHHGKAKNTFKTYQAKKRSVWHTFVSSFLPRQNLPNDPFASAESGSPLPSPAYDRPQEQTHADTNNPVGISPEVVLLSQSTTASASSSVTLSLSLSDGEDEHARGQQLQPKAQKAASNDSNNGDSGAEAASTRAAVLAAALSHFPGATERYHIQRAEHAVMRREKLFWERVRDELPAIVITKQMQWAETGVEAGSAGGGEEGGGECKGAGQEQRVCLGNGTGKVSKERVRHIITALQRWTVFESETRSGPGAKGQSMGCLVGVNVPRLRNSPVDDAQVQWTRTPTTSAPTSEDDLLTFIIDNWDVAYELDRALSRPGRQKRREETARRKAERVQREKQEDQEPVVRETEENKKENSTEGG